MPVIGQDCDVLLYHQAVQAGVPVGFLLDRSRLYHGSISVFRSAYRQAEGDFNDQQVVSFTVLLGNDLINPDGSRRSDAAGMQ